MHRQAYFRSYATHTDTNTNKYLTQRTHHSFYACQNITVGNLDKPFTRPIPFFIWHTHARNSNSTIWNLANSMLLLHTHKHCVLSCAMLCSIFYIYFVCCRHQTIIWLIQSLPTPRRIECFEEIFRQPMCLIRGLMTYAHTSLANMLDVRKTIYMNPIM